MEGIEWHRIDLRDSGFSAHARLLAEGRKHLRTGTGWARLVVAHRTLLPVATILNREPSACGITVVCHGSDVWGARPRIRRRLEDRMIRSSAVRAVAASSFTAGALSGRRQALILPPGLSREWFDTLVEASAIEQPGTRPVRVLTTFRLSDWRSKGLPQLLDAVAGLERSDVEVIVSGSGEPSLDLLELMEKYPSCSLRPGLSDRGLAAQFAAADLFVLATRTQHGKEASGEGFGLVLVEAQVAGTPVIGPAYGGSHDAYIDGVTGVAPIDESAEALTKVLERLLQNPSLLGQMGRNASEWARRSFDPDHYAELAVTRLL
jgi:phosphatidyl-myo-inositol dimannoside synthase